MGKIKPSERYLLCHRLFTFLDEWMFYGVLFLLYYHGKMKEDPILFVIVAVLGASFILISYGRQWLMEADRFEHEED